MIRRQRIKEMWNRFAGTVLTGTSELQRDEMRKAFYAGAAALFEVMTRDVSEGPETTEGDMQIMGDIDAEFKDFIEREKEKIQ